MTRTRTIRSSAATAVVVLGSLGLASGASASDASLKAASVARAPQFHAVAKQQGTAFRAWLKADHSRKTSKAVLRTLKAAQKLERADTKAVQAQAPSTPTGTQAKQDLLLSNAYYARYLKALERAVPLATAGHNAAANKQLRLATGYATQSGEQATAAKKLLVQIG